MDFDKTCIKSDVCGMAVCDGADCKHRADALAPVAPDLTEVKRYCAGPRGMIETNNDLGIWVLYADILSHLSTPAPAAPVCGSCGSGTVKVVCGSCAETRCYGVWSDNNDKADKVGKVE